MMFLGLIKKSIRYYWRANVAIVLACAVAAAVLVGALVVGDSVRHTLGLSLGWRLGRVEYALLSNDRFFRAELASDMQEQVKIDFASVLILPGVAVNDASAARVNNINILGVDSSFFNLGLSGGDPFGGDWGDGVVVNEQLGRRLGVEAGDEILLRIAKPSAMPRDIPLTPGSDFSVALRLRVKAVAGAPEFGKFNLYASQIEPLNAFVPIGLLGGKIERAGFANMLLVGETTLDAAELNEMIGQVFEPEDMQVSLRELDGGRGIELQSDRVFVDDVIADAAMQVGDRPQGVLTYFVNELSAGDNSTPYSMVTAGVIGLDMGDDQIIINRWLASDLGAVAGDAVTLKYYVLGKKRELIERTSSFVVRSVIGMDSVWVDETLMPEFPGLSGQENCRDWDPGIPIDLSRIRDKDEDYWDRFRGSPKAFVTLGAGQKMWGNRYGQLTAIRYRGDGVSLEGIADGLKRSVDPASVGLYFRDVGAQGQRAATEAADFGGLFVGFSIFLIVSAVIVMGLVFVFGVQSRSGQIGMLMGVGYERKHVKRLFFLEGALLTVVGVCVGTACGLLYTRAIIFGLTTVWRQAVAGSVISFHVEGATLITGGAISAVVCLSGIALSLRKQLRQSPSVLMEQSCEQEPSLRKKGRARVALTIGVLSCAASICVIVFMGSGNEAAVFFGAGSSLLIGSIAITIAILKAGSTHKASVAGSLGALAFRNCSRRTGRSTAVVTLLACGSFMVVAVGANRHSPLAHAQDRDSGTGGFALMAEASIGIVDDLNSSAGREAVGLDASAIDGAGVVAMRIYDGDDASCLNLNRPQKPRLLAVDPGEMQSRGAFGKIDTLGDAPQDQAWRLLSGNWGEDTVAAFGDHNTVVWMLGKSVGDEIEYVDERGRRFNVKIVGTFRNSILQGSLIVDEDRFVERFGGQGGYRMLLIDAPPERTEAVSSAFSLGLRDYGVEVVAATDRLGELSAVENTYLSIFQMLGGLGLVLGSVGVAMVVVFNVLDRRRELAMLRAIGFDKTALKRMVLCEHFSLTLWGLFCGSVAALVAVVPAMRMPGGQVPYLSLAVTMIAVALASMLWTWIAASMALSGELIEALRTE